MTIKKVVIWIVILAIIGWFIGFRDIARTSEFLIRGSGSTQKIHQFYKAAARRDSSAFLSLFSEKILQKENRSSILSAFKWGTGTDLWARNLAQNHQISNKWMHGDTAIIHVKITSDYEGRNITFRLLKEAGEWKIVFPE